MPFNLKTAIGTIAPTLATMLGGPLAGTAVAALAGAFGLAPSATADDVTKVVQAGMTPETIAAVRAADQKHAEIMSQQQIDVQKLNADHEAAIATIDASDRDSARKREATVGGFTTPMLAWTIVAASVAMGTAVVMGYVTKDPVQGTMVGTVIGYLFGESKQVLSYYFGSSAGSARKDITIANQSATGIQQ